MSKYGVKKNRSGSTFIIVIGVLGIIVFAASLFMTSTTQEGRETAMSIRGLHATSLAEASIERAMRLITERVNKVSNTDTENFKADNFGFKLRMPATEGNNNYGQSTNFGTDNDLNLSDEAKKEQIFTKDDLQADGTELDKLVDYMTNKGHDSYEVTVTAKVTNAFRNSPGNDYPDFKVPGVDIGWNTRYDVKNFLDGKGYTLFDMQFPSGMNWLKFSIPIKIGPVKICDINVSNVVDKLVPKFTTPKGNSYGFNDVTEMDGLARIILNEIIAKDKDIYPIKVRVDNVKIPKVSDLWPINISQGDGQYLEKYGQISLECEAKITYKDHYTSTRRVTAIKEFKVADCEPPAPMYSFFVNNLQNERIAFNNYGGQFTVNSFDYTGSLAKVKDLITGGSTFTDEDFEKNEYPGLIRVNYKDESPNKNFPINCNVGLIGDWGATKAEGDDSGFGGSLCTGAEGLMLLCPDASMAAVGAKYNINAEIKQKETDTNEEVPDKLKNTYEKGEDSNPSTDDGASSNYGLQFKNQGKVAPAEAKDWLKGLTGGMIGGINLVPDVGEMSTNVISLAITLALKPLVAQVPVVKDVVKVPDCFESWDMPAMGTKNSLYPIPTTGTGENKTHLFGKSGFHPTMTKEIEGNVMKNYRQWSMCIVGMNPTDRLPLLPFPPVFLPPPPLVVPIWKAGDVIEKYDFNLENFKAHDDTGNAESEANEYDPKKLENMAPNLYTNEQYAKKATYYYETAQDFLDDLPNRITDLNGEPHFVLNGITYITGSLGEPNNPFTVDGGTLNVVGKGMIVCSGNIYLGCNIIAKDRSENDHTVFTLLSRKGGLLIMQGGKQFRIEGSLYTERGVYLHPDSSLHVVGNWVTNSFCKPAMGGTVVVDYVSSRVRSSLGSLHPTNGKYDPSRYNVSFSPVWSSWRSH